MLNNYPPKQKDRLTTTPGTRETTGSSRNHNVKGNAWENISSSASQYFFPVLFVLIYITGEVILVQD